VLHGIFQRASEVLGCHLKVILASNLDRIAHPCKDHMGRVYLSELGLPRRPQVVK